MSDQENKVDVQEAISYIKNLELIARNNEELQDKVHRLTEKVKMREERISEYQDKLTSQEEEFYELNKIKQELQQDFDALKEKYDESKNDLIVSTTKIEVLMEMIQELTAEATDAKQFMERVRNGVTVQEDYSNIEV